MKKKRLWIGLVCAALGLAACILAARAMLSEEQLYPLRRLLHTGKVENMYNDYVFSVDASAPGETLPNVKSNLNRYGGRFTEDPVLNTEENPYDFIEYIQLMECSGGNPTRDLFKDPENWDVLDDYDFSALIASCKGILKTGAKPLLKLGNVPSKLSRDTLRQYTTDGAFDVNVYPPDDYNEYYTYIKNTVLALADEFGLDEVRKWRFGVFTEYENADWFHAPDRDPEESLTAFCKIYDYTVQALIDVLGPDVFVGAHSMSVSEGLWDEEDFIYHCGKGTNYATGETGTRICYLSASYYEVKPGEFGANQLPLPQIMERFKTAAAAAGLDNLLYGVDEGRILVGVHAGSTSNELYSRTVGDTYQAAFDARLVKQMFDTGMSWFSSWEYCAEPDNHGNPLMSYYVAKYAARFAGAKQIDTTAGKTGLLPGADVSVSAAYNEETETLHVMAYNYKNSLYYLSGADVTLNINVPQLAGKDVTVTAYRISDDCNWFNAWKADRKALGITDDKFSWSPDDGCPLFADADAKQTFLGLQEKYAAIRLTPDAFPARVNGDGTLTLNERLGPNNVTFLEITEGVRS